MVKLLYSLFEFTDISRCGSIVISFYDLKFSELIINLLNSKLYLNKIIAIQVKEKNYIQIPFPIYLQNIKLKLHFKSK